MNTTNNPITVKPNNSIAVPYHDELSMLEILDILLKNKILLIIVTTLITVASVFYALSVKPTYQSTVYLAHPDNRSIIEMNVSNQKNESYSQKSVYEKFVANFNSKNLKTIFLEKINLITYYCQEVTPQCKREASNGFSSSLILDEKEFIATLTLSMDALTTAETLNNYTNYIDKYTTNEIATNIQATLTNKINLLENKIKVLIDSYKKELSNEIATIDEALQIAKKLNYKNVQKTQVSALPLYFFGYDFLEAKKEALLSRKKIQAFIPQISVYEKEISNLKAVKYNTDLFHSISIDQYALAPKYPIKPKKRTIVILGFTLGFIFSLFIILILQIRKNLITYRLNLTDA